MEEKIRQLVALAEQLGLAELEVRQGDETIRFRFDQAVASTGLQRTPPRGSAAASAASEPRAPGAGPLQGTVVRAPMAGTFYRSPGPGERHFVEMGDTVSVGDVLCIIESMKMMNRLESEHAGRISAVLVHNGANVQVDQPLFTLE